MNKAAVFFLVAFLVSAAAAGYLWTESSRMKSANAELEEKVTALEEELAEAQTEARQAHSTAAASLDAQKSELLRLRGEVTQRRESAGVAEKLQVENTRLANELRELRKTAQQATAAAAAAQHQQQQQILAQQAAAQQAAIAQANVAPQGQQLGQEQPGNPNVPGDPLASFRRNPELMKRYFPHLAEQEFGTNAPPVPVP